MPTGDPVTQVWVMEPTRTALVMGSSQRPEAFDAERLAADGVELAGRRSGGGAVFIAPASAVWIDLLIPKGSPLWSDQLVETFMIAGRVWLEALTQAGFDGLELVVSAPGRDPYSAAACWAGRGWGEVVAGATKVVGLSQRRTRWGARVQTMAVFDATPRRVADYLVTGPVLDRATVLDRIGPAPQLASTGMASENLEIHRNRLIELVVLGVAKVAGEI